MPLRNVSDSYLRQAADLEGNPGQQAAYNSTGHCVVLAGPGSGKTKTLVLKLARILAKDVETPRGVWNFWDCATLEIFLLAPFTASACGIL
jgi:DNA helicase II / ATP-dependent DNA helicase PcrA